MYGDFIYYLNQKKKLFFKGNYAIKYSAKFYISGIFV